MNHKIAFLTTVFPMKEEYLYDCFNSLEKQTYKKFDVIVVNDGYIEFNKFINKYSKLNLIEIKYSNTPAKNREYGINYSIDNNYDILIFGDSDDYFSENRVEKIIKLLDKYDIVVNDLILFSDNKVYDEKYISNRIDNGTLIDVDFIRDKNIFGFTNTAINLSKLEGQFTFDKNIIAVDWYFFSKLLKNGLKAIFTNETCTYYRQHENSLVGLGKISEELIQKALTVKSKHYSLLNWDQEYEMVEKLKLLDTKKYFNYLVSNRINNSLWWEEIRQVDL